MWRATLFGLLALGICFAQDAIVRAPFEGRQFTAAQAAAAEAAVAANPDDVRARLNLLGYYWTQSNASGSADVNRAARVNQLLWLIANHPDSAVFTLPDGAVPEAAYTEQIKQAWQQALIAHYGDVRVLSNAAWYYRVSDKQQSLDLLRRAQASNPMDRQIADRVGNEYALILLDPAESNSALAQNVRIDLDRSTDAVVLYATGSALHCCNAGRNAELDVLSNTLIERAKTLDPTVLPQRIRVGGNVQAANLMNKVSPLYSLQAKQARIQGVVRFSAVIAKDGTIQTLQLISGHPLLVAPAQEAVKQWTYKPTLLNGLPVEVATQIDVNFTLQP